METVILWPSNFPMRRKQDLQDRNGRINRNIFHAAGSAFSSPAPHCESPFMGFLVYPQPAGVSPILHILFFSNTKPSMYVQGCRGNFAKAKWQLKYRFSHFALFGSKESLLKVHRRVC